jgi:hypothetical protein
MPDRRAGRLTPRRAVALLLVGALIGTMLITPAGAHVGGTVSHLWTKHIRPKADARYYRKSQVAWAVVSSSGALVRGARATSASKLATGNYEVIFRRTVAQCAYQATVADSTLGAEIGAEPRTGNAKGVFVTTWSSNGNPADKPFHLVVICG